MKDARTLFALWPDKKSIALDAKRSVVDVDNWSKRNRIPPEVFVTLADGAESRGLPVTLRDIAETRSVVPESRPSEEAS